jgi:hypothetical protein
MTPLGQLYWTLPIAGVICGLSVILQENWTERSGKVDLTVDEMERRVARWGKVKPYEQTFIESRLPGFEKRLYKIINRGVLENEGVEPRLRRPEFHANTRV